MPSALRHLLPALLFFVAVTSHAGCLVTKKTCIDPGATRVIDGIADAGLLGLRRRKDVFETRYRDKRLRDPLR